MNDDLIKGVPAGTNLSPVATGQKEFRSDPSDFMNLLNGMDLNEMKRLAGQKTTSVNESSGTLSEDTAAMKNILLKLDNSANYGVEKSLRDKKTKNDIKRAIINESNIDKEWQIRINESKGKAFYDVINVNAKKSFFKDLYLQESAKQLCYLLENGHHLNSRDISTVLYYDHNYGKNYDDAIRAKRNYKLALKKGNESKAQIYENEFEVARSKAIKARKDLKKLRT